MPTEPLFFNRSNPKTKPAPPLLVSRWINHRCPPWAEILSAHDVARLMRRPSWWLFALSLVGRFPRKANFRGRTLGWRRSEVLGWLARDLEFEPARSVQRRHRRRRRRPIQRCLPPSRASHDDCR